MLRGAVVQVFRRLMDGVEPALVAAAEHEISAVNGVVGIRRIRMRWDGHRLTADADIDDTQTSPSPPHATSPHTAELLHDHPLIVVRSCRGAAGCTTL